MQYMGLNEIREKYLAYFESKEHLRLPSFSLIPQGDASLLLINSGMAPMKPYFTGEQEPPRRRVTTCQKCIRTGDIENVGKTARHGTFFEMLGNFSFGDYFKEEAIAWSWEFLTKVMGLEADRLYPSIYTDDDESFEIWNKKIGIAPERIFRFGKPDNFWEHGAGPCGPCSEIYYDRGEKFGCGEAGCTVGCDCDRYMEIWNNVFTQFSNDGQGNYTELAQKNIDTGMGLERLAVVVQGVGSLFEVDTVRNIMQHISGICKVEYGAKESSDISLRVITDHIRSTVMMVCDGVLPSNEGRGYVLRRLLRRAARHGKLLGIDRPFLSEVAQTVIKESGGAYPALTEKQDFILKVITMEENSFDKTIDSGLSILNDLIAEIKAQGKTELPGADAFKLYDTYGFPIDLTLELLEEQGMSTARDEFDALMQEQRVRARKAREKMGDLGWVSDNLGLDKGMKTEFLGYDATSAQGKVLAIVADEEISPQAAAGAKVTVVLDQTPFYAESGGQIGDRGELAGDSGCAVMVEDTQKTKDGKIMHIGTVKEGILSVGQTVTAAVDAERRQATCRAHSVTHLLQKALRNVLGGHVEQAGSYNEPDHIRFDFTHFAAMTPEELSAVENMVNEEILNGLAIETMEMSIDEAKKMGAMALFGEKYGNTVRVVKMGDFSTELCGGTHLDNTAKASIFKITGENSVAAGVRRIEAVTGRGVLELLNKRQEMILDLSKALKTTPAALAQKAKQVIEDLRDASRDLDKMRAKMANMQMSDLLLSAKEIGGVRIVAAKIDDASPEALRSMGDAIKERQPGMVAVLSSVGEEGKISLLAVCGADALKAGAHAGKLIKEVAKLCGGGGGGRPDSAAAGGKDPEKLDAALAAVSDIVAGQLK